MNKKTCAYCKQRFTPIRSFQKNCLETACIEANNQKFREKKKKLNRKALKDFNDSDVAVLKRKAQTAFNRYIRARDKKDNLPCISCLKPNDGTFDCGHFKPRGSYSALAFNEDNCSGQCKKCNRFLSANLINYRKNLIDKIGIERVEFLETSTHIKKWTVEELSEIIKTYNLKYKRLTEDML